MVQTVEQLLKVFTPVKTLVWALWPQTKAWTTKNQQLMAANKKVSTNLIIKKDSNSFLSNNLRLLMVKELKKMNKSTLKPKIKIALTKIMMQQLLILTQN